ncbi:MAG: signal peptidase I [Candidatus Binatia bacterium]|nr:MAG: signal peptidase I [Candidatus Binatia bacterium]
MARKHEPASEATKKKSAAREYAEALGTAVLLALLLRTFVVQAFKIPSGSMEPTLQIGDYILVNKLVYGPRVPFLGKRLYAFSRPRRGDVIVFVYPVDPSKDFIKRVAAVEGDTIEIRDKKVYVNGTLAQDCHAYFADGENGTTLGPRDNYGPLVVPPGKVFVLGDNRDRSYDSRFWTIDGKPSPFVDLDAIKGKAFLIYWSWDGNDRWVRWERLGDRIH